MDIPWRSAGSRMAPKLIRAFSYVLSVFFIFVLLLLFIRSILRLELRWDAFFYHLPFAAIRGGLDLPYVFNDTLDKIYQGFPPLAHFIQGLLWRVTGSVNATGCVNLLAFLAFLIFCHRRLKAPFWLVAMIALSAPLVLIHTTVNYIDLFGNSLLAIGITAFIYLFYFNPQNDRALLIWGLLGLIGAAWSKFMMAPLAALMFVLYATRYLLLKGEAAPNKRQMLLLIGLAAVVAALPYLKNLVLYGNPFWPIKVPFFHEFFPYTRDMEIRGVRSIPPPISYLNRFQLFLHSLFEINHPTRYSYRPRWILDQGSAWLAFRMGGFWYVGVMVFLSYALILPLFQNTRRGICLALGFIGLIGLVACLPQSHQLRYYMFLPLCWAATIGMFYRRFAKEHARATLLSLLIFIALFSHMVHENWPYYIPERITYRDAAHKWGADQYWPILDSQKKYCAVGMEPIGILLTGPTMREFTIIDRSRQDLCPAGTRIIKFPDGKKPY